MKASIHSDMMFKPLCFEYSSEEARAVEDQLLVGDSLMIAPIYEQNAKGRMVYLPEKMLLWRANDFENMSETQFEEIEEGYHYLKVALDELLIFIRPGKLLPLVTPMDRVSKLKVDEFTVVGYGGEGAKYELYEDDGESFDFIEGKFILSTLEAEEDQMVKSDNKHHVIKNQFMIIA